MDYTTVRANGFRPAVRRRIDIKVLGCECYFTPNKTGIRCALDFVRSLGYNRCVDTTQTVYDLLMAGF